MNFRERAAPYLIAAFLGAASVLAFAPTAWFALSWLTLGCLFLLLEKNIHLQSFQLTDCFQ